MKRQLMSLILVVPITLASACQEGEKPIVVKVVFADRGGLEVGGEVQVSSVRVGEVSKIDLTDDNKVVAHLVIDPEHRDRVTEDAQFRIKRKSLLSGTRHVELTPGSGQPVSNGAQFDGDSGAFDWGKVKNVVDDIKKKISSPEVQEKLDDVAAAVRDAASAGKEEWEKRRPEIEQKVEELMKKAEEEGPETAEKLREQIEKLLQEGEREAEDAPAPDEER